MYSSRSTKDNREITSSNKTEMLTKSMNIYIFGQLVHQIKYLQEVLILKLNFEKN